MEKGRFLKLSVITPVLNAAEFLERTIQNVISQNYPELEHIIVDGGSTDGTLEIIKKYPSVRLIQEKGSQSKAFNIGFQAATGEILGAVNGDDTYSEGIFHFVNEYFLNHPDCEFLMGNVQFMEKGKLGFLNVPRHTMPEMIYWWEKNAYCFNPVGYFYTPDVRDSVPPFKEDNHYDMDHAFLLEAGSRFRIHKVEKTFGNFYFHEKNKTSEMHRENYFTHYLKVKKKTVQENLHLLGRLDRYLFLFSESFFLCRLFPRERKFGRQRFRLSEYFHFFLAVLRLFSFSHQICLLSFKRLFKKPAVTRFFRFFSSFMRVFQRSRLKDAAAFSGRKFCLISDEGKIISSDLSFDLRKGRIAGSDTHRDYSEFSDCIKFYDSSGKCSAEFVFFTVIEGSVLCAGFSEADDSLLFLLERKDER